MGVLFLSRDDWGAGPLVAGAAAPHSQFLGLVIHHTVTTFNPGDDPAAHMWWLQKVRPDLGSEIPYSFVVFPTTDPDSCVVAEGRGWGRTGAHTVGYNCLDPNHKILTADLRWVPAGELAVGDQLLAFDEEASGLPGSCRGLQVSTVLHNAIEDEERFLVTLADGSEVITTATHPWLVYSGHNFAWVETRNLRFGGKVVSRVVRSFDPWEMEDTRDAGWLAGFLDGEGCITASRAGGACYVQYAQKPGPVFEMATELLERRGHVITRREPLGGRSTSEGQVRGGCSETLRLLGEIRPERLIRNLPNKRDSLPTMRALNNVGVAVMSVEAIGVGPIARLGTSTKTYFADGFAMHNSTAYGVAFAGNFQNDTPTPGMLEGVRWIGRRLADPINALHTIGHREVYGTACPGANTVPLLGKIQPPFTEPTEDDMPLSDDDVARIRDAVLDAPIATRRGTFPLRAVIGWTKDEVTEPDLLLARIDAADEPAGFVGEGASAAEIANELAARLAD